MTSHGQCHTGLEMCAEGFNNEENSVTGIMSYHRGIKLHHSDVTCVQSALTQPPDLKLYFAR